MKRRQTTPSIWVVQYRAEGGWKNQRSKHGMPLMADTEYEAEQLISTLDGTRTYRVIRVQD